MSDYAYAIVSGSGGLSAPTNLTATPSGSGISLTWTGVDGASSYKVYRSTSPNGSYTRIKTNIIISDTFCTDSDLLSAGTYYYKVSAVSAASIESPQSSPASATVSGSLSAPTGLSVRRLGDGGARLSWTSVSNASSYKIYHSTSASGTYDPLDTISGLSYDNSGLTPGTSYYYKVSAISSSGSEGPQSDYVSITAGTGSGTQAAPSGLSAAASGSSVSLSWNSANGAARYFVYRSTSPNGSYTRIKTNITISGTFCTDSGLSAGTYYYKVSAVSAASIESPQSGYVSVSVGGSGSAPITNISYSNGSGGTCTWTLQSDGRRKSPAIGHGAATKARVSFTSTVSNASIIIQLDVSSEPLFDYAFISTLDNRDATYNSGYYSGSRISGTDSVTVTIPVPTPGSHFIEVGYRKDGAGSDGSDCAWFKVVQ
jgi:fibronectin type 3 domain-containing protein